MLHKILPLLMAAVLFVGQEECATEPPPPTHAEIPDQCVPSAPDICNSFDDDCDCTIFGPNDDNGDGEICGPGDTNVDEDCTGEPVEEDLVGVTENQLVVVDSRVGTTTVLMDFEEPLSGASGLTFDPATGMGYAVSSSQRSLHEIDPTGGTVTPMFNLSGLTTNLHALALAPITVDLPFEAGTLYGVSLDGAQMENGENCGPNCLVQVDMLTGVVTPLGAMNTQQVRGMAFNPFTGELWVYDPGNHTASTVEADGTVTEQFILDPSDPGLEQGVNPMFSLAFNCEGEMLGVTVDYMLVYINRAESTGHWVQGGDADLIKEIQGLTGYCF